MIKKWLENFGQYCLFMSKVISVPQKWHVFGTKYIQEIGKLGMDSIPLTIIISIFIGAVICIQMQLNMVSPLMPAYSTGLATRDILLLEFSSAVLCLILAGKVGSNIASEIGTMRVTEQIDALEIMGINSACFLVLPKILAFMTFIPILVIFSIATGLFGGWIISAFTDLIPVSRYIFGIQTMFNEWYVWYTIIKSLVFSVIITSVASYSGYYVKGGALDVGKSSTRAVVDSSILILFFDVVLTKLLLQ